MNHKCHKKWSLTLTQKVLVLHGICQAETFEELLCKFLQYGDYLRGYTIIKSAARKDTINLYEGMTDIEGITDYLRTPFHEGRVYVLPASWLCSREIDYKRIAAEKCISLDSQVLSYLKSKDKGNERFDDIILPVMEIFHGKKTGISILPFIMESKMNGKTQPNYIYENVLWFEQFFYGDKKQFNFAKSEQKNFAMKASAIMNVSDKKENYCITGYTLCC